MAIGYVSNTFTVLAEVYNCTRGSFWRKCTLNDCSILYFSGAKWFQEHFKATTYIDIDMHVHVCVRGRVAEAAVENM
jgi:hypothetical protein